jgi:hypothetical protein
LAPIDPERLAEVVAWFADKPAGAVKSASIAPTGYLLDTRQVLEIRQALGYVDPDENYETWIQVGMALQSTGTDNAFGLWNEWSQVGPKYNAQIMRAKWSSFSDKPNGITLATIFGLAQDRGWVNPASNESAAFLASTPSIETHPAPVVAKSAVASVYAFPRHLLSVPGLVGDVAQFINDSALYPQPVLALASSLAFCGALFGRKVATESDLRTNIYIMGVADSASGKEHARKAIKKLSVAADVVALVGAEKIASDQGLFALLAEQPACVCLLDEFGRTLRILNNDRAPAHLQQLVTTLLELTGSADSYIMEKRRAEHGTENPPRVITNPNLCLYATTVPGRLYQGLTPDEITDGFLPRWLIFETDTPDPEMSLTILKIPSVALLESINTWKQRALKTNLLTNAPDPDVIPVDAGASRVLAQYMAIWRDRKTTARGTGLDALWGRAYEHALRLALIRGAGDGERITEPCAAWSCELADFLLTRTAEQALANVATNDYESGLQKVASFIRAQGQASMRDLSRKFRWLKPKERDAIISALVDEQSVETRLLPGNSRPTVMLYWVADSVVPSVVPLSQMAGTTEHQ